MYWQMQWFLINSTLATASLHFTSKSRTQVKGVFLFLCVPLVVKINIWLTKTTPCTHLIYTNMKKEKYYFDTTERWCFVVLCDHVYIRPPPFSAAHKILKANTLIPRTVVAGTAENRTSSGSGRVRRGSGKWLLDIPTTVPLPCRVLCRCREKTGVSDIVPSS